MLGWALSLAISVPALAPANQHSQTVTVNDDTYEIEVGQVQAKDNRGVWGAWSPVFLFSTE